MIENKYLDTGNENFSKILLTKQNMNETGSVLKVFMIF